MEWMDYLNESVKYIEEHLTDEIDLNKVSKIAGCSSYHYQRMFSYIANIPLSEYIRRRRMTKAALDLQSSNEKIIHIALKYGYESPTAFNRAFQSVHGVAPSLARENGIQLKAFPPISFQLSIKGEIELKYKIVKMDSFKIIGVKEHYLINIEDNFQNIPLFWAKTTQTGVIPSILSRMNQEPFGLLGVSTCMNGKDFEYYIAVSSNGETPSDL
ncbi:MAG: AraC family transcriptional regulator, partial [Anaerocolumna sp.]|nr:AraC family transcriptional regulator [Anaerocolumna sp.]